MAYPSQPKCQATKTPANQQWASNPTCMTRGMQSSARAMPKADWHGAVDAGARKEKKACEKKKVISGELKTEVPEKRHFVPSKHHFQKSPMLHDMSCASSSMFKNQHRVQE
jgi:hypothetical protein